MRTRKKTVFKNVIKGDLRKIKSNKKISFTRKRIFPEACVANANKEKCRIKKTIG